MKSNAMFKYALAAMAIGAVLCASNYAEASAPGVDIRVGNGFGINQFRGFNTNAATQYFIDGDAITGEPTLAQMGLGTRVNVQLDASANSSVTEGNATNVFIDTALAGPISAISPQIRVLGQVLTITADTVLVDIPGNNISELQVGQLL